MKISYIICDTEEEVRMSEDYFFDQWVHYLSGEWDRTHLKPRSENMREHIEWDPTLIVTCIDGDLFTSNTEHFLYKDDLHKFKEIKIDDITCNVCKGVILKSQNESNYAWIIAHKKCSDKRMKDMWYEWL